MSATHRAAVRIRCAQEAGDPASLGSQAAPSLQSTMMETPRCGPNPQLPTKPMGAREVLPAESYAPATSGQRLKGGPANPTKREPKWKGLPTQLGKRAGEARVESLVLGASPLRAAATGV